MKSLLLFNTLFLSENNVIHKFYIGVFYVDLGNIIVQPAQDVNVKAEAELGRISYRGKVETNPFQLKKGQKGEVILTVEAGNIEIR